MNSQALAKAMLRNDEGLRLKPYYCTAVKLTIGYGRNLEDRGISENEAEVLLENDVSEIHEDLSEIYDFFNTLTPTRQAVLISMAFNLGLNGLNKFRKMIKAIEDNDYAEAASQMLDSRWANQVGKRAQRLSKLMVTG